jgi:hypothetical protein
VQDLVYLALLFAFFSLAGLLVVACDRIIGPDEKALLDRGAPEPEGESEKRAA